MSDCEKVAKGLYAQLFDVDAYLGLCVDYGIENIAIEDWKNLGTIESHADAYLQVPSVDEAIDSSLHAIQSRVGSITLKQLSELPPFYHTLQLIS